MFSGDMKNAGQYYFYNDKDRPIASTSYLRAPGIQKQGSARPLSDLTGQVIRQNNYPDACGGFADVYMASWKSENVGTLIGLNWHVIYDENDR